MKHLNVLSCSVAALSCLQLVAAVPTFVPRSQSVNVAREMVGWQQFINLSDAESNYSVFSITPEYSKSFRAKELAQCLFGSDASVENCSNTVGINISGSAVPNRGSSDWLADYFGLGVNYQGTLYLTPQVTNFLVDLNYYQGLDSLLSGLYFRVHAPVVNTRWNLNVSEAIITPGSEVFVGYFNTGGTPGIQLVPTALNFFSGQQAANYSETLSATQCSQSILTQKLQSSTFAFDGCRGKDLSKTGLSDIEFALGWNFLNCDYGLLGLSLRASAPTGNAPCGNKFFAPLIGDGHHWKFGAGLNGQTMLWTSDCEDQSIGLYLDARVQHLFSARQTRSFDLCGKPNSRYMLAQKLGTNLLPIHITGKASDGVEFQNEFAPVANLTNACVNVKIAVEGDIGIKLAYMSDVWEFDLGYDFWARSCEKICRNKCNVSPLADGDTWALKGDAFVFGFNGTVPTETCFRLAAVEPDATINAGTNLVGPAPFTSGGINGVVPAANPGIANPIELTAANAGIQINDIPAGEVITPVATRSSNPVTFLTDADVDLSGSKGLSNKIFANISRTWECDCYTPFLGIGGEIEFAPQNCKKVINPILPSTAITTDCVSSCASSCTSGNNCQRCSLSQWGIWVKGGIAFE